MITHSNLRNSRWAPVEHFNCSLRTGRRSSYARLFQLYYFFFRFMSRAHAFFSCCLYAFGHKRGLCSCSICALGHERAPFSVVALALLVLSALFFRVCSFLKGSLAYSRVGVGRESRGGGGTETKEREGGREGER